MADTTRSYHCSPARRRSPPLETVCCSSGSRSIFYWPTNTGKGEISIINEHVAMRHCICVVSCPSRGLTGAGAHSRRVGVGLGGLGVRALGDFEYIRGVGPRMSCRIDEQSSERMDSSGEWSLRDCWMLRREQNTRMPSSAMQKLKVDCESSQDRHQ